MRACNEPVAWLPFEKAYSPRKAAIDADLVIATIGFIDGMPGCGRTWKSALHHT
jgi:hypothetical protein